MAQAPSQRPYRKGIPIIALSVLVALALPVAADHVQTATSGGTSYKVQFDHGGDNEWWVEVYTRGHEGDFPVTVSGIVEGGGGFSMTAVATEWDRTQQGWQKWAPNQQTPSHVPPGRRVMFEAAVLDEATGTQQMMRSCWFTHPAGIEQCGTTSTTTTTSPPSGFDATFTGVRGNEWWVQANVATNGPAIAKVDVREYANGAWGAFQPMNKQNWGPTAWAASYHIPQGTIVQLRATATDGRTDLSSCRQWIPNSGQDAPIVACPGPSSSSTSTSSSPSAFDATFSNVRGNSYWVEAIVTSNTANRPVHLVSLRIDCSADLHPMQYRADWGKWVIGKALPTGAKVTLVAQNNGDSDPVYDHSGGYVWPQATPTSGC